jgi:hypothetical protein
MYEGEWNMEYNAELKQAQTDDTIEGPTEAQLHQLWGQRWAIWNLIQWSLEWGLSSNKTLSVHKKEYQDAAVEMMAIIEGIRPLRRN